MFLLSCAVPNAHNFVGVCAVHCVMLYYINHFLEVGGWEILSGPRFSNPSRACNKDVSNRPVLSVYVYK